MVFGTTPSSTASQGPTSRPIRGLRAIWSDGSRLESGRSGASIAWKDVQGGWKARGFPLGKEKEVFDAELLGIVQALQLTMKIRSLGLTIVLLDSQVAISRLQHT